MADYDDVKQQLGPGPENDGFAALLSGELPDGTAVYSPTVIYGTRDPLTTPTPVVWEMDNVGPWGVTIDVGHHQRHEGDSFSACYVDATLADTETIVIHIKVGADKAAHLLYHVTCPGAFTVALYENPTTSGDGTTVAVNNHNRNSSSTADTTVFHTPSSTGNGTLLEQYYIGGGSQRAGGESRSAAEWVLKKSEQYLLVVTSRANGNSGAVVLDWYEEGASA